MSTTGEPDDFNEIQFEKKLTGLKDSQDSINACCQWCLSNRQHHKKIVNSWLNVLKRVKVEQRLVLFYLANDVIQYSKRRKLNFVESWGTALQKATTLVRDDKVKHKIQRIFKIWEDRGIYSEEFISDLCGLISVTTTPKNDEPHEFQSNYVINKIRVCANLENDTDLKLKKLKELTPKSIETESFFATLKDRAHLDDSEKELDVYISSMEEYINALKVEVKSRINLISVLKQAETQLDTDRKDVKIVANAYRTFGTKVKTFQKRLEEHKIALSSPIPSPDVNAPSPTSDNDIDLPDGIENGGSRDKFKDTSVRITNANYYNPVPAPSDSNAQFSSNGFTTFMGSTLPFNIQNFSDSNTFPTNNSENNSYSYPPDKHTTPLLPPPMPPFETKEDASFGSYSDYNAEIDYGSSSFNNSSFSGNVQYPPSYGNSGGNTSYDPIATLFGSKAPIGANPYPPQSDEYNPEDDLQTWENWDGPTTLDNLETPESPPLYETKSHGKPVEYRDNHRSTSVVDVDHRIIPSSQSRADVDHRNLISLIGGSPDTNLGGDAPEWLKGKDQDYRVRPKLHQGKGDRDYRVTEQQLKLPPPPLPPQHFAPLQPAPSQQTDESVDMDVSDEEGGTFGPRDNLKVVIGRIPGVKGGNSPDDYGSKKNSQDGMMKPPPPLPELPDDAEENMFLDQMNSEINEFILNSEESEHSSSRIQWNNEIPPQNISMFPANVLPPLLPTPIDFDRLRANSYQFNNGGGGDFYGRKAGRDWRGKFNNNISNRGRNNREFINRTGGFRDRGRGFRGGRYGHRDNQPNY